MHFRVRGNSVQVVKTIVDKKTLSSKSVPVGSANIQTGVLSEPLLSSLSAKELQEVRQWLHSRQQFERMRKEVDARLLEQRIYDVIAWLQEDPPRELAVTVVDDALRAMGAFRHVATRRGLTK
jgi:hypothetical protein